MSYVASPRTWEILIEFGALAVQRDPTSAVVATLRVKCEENNVISLFEYLSEYFIHLSNTIKVYKLKEEIKVS